MNGNIQAKQRACLEHFFRGAIQDSDVKMSYQSGILLKFNRSPRWSQMRRMPVLDNQPHSKICQFQKHGPFVIRDRNSIFDRQALSTKDQKQSSMQSTIILMWCENNNN